MPNVSFWIWLILTSAFSAIIAGWWWLEYGVEMNKRFWMWVGFWFMLMIELLWVIQLLPLGYLVSSLLLIWCWYIVWLLARFNLMPEGINWRKQIWFLALNSVLFVSFVLFVVRWK